MNHTKLAAAYLRVSTNEQAEFSPDAQLSAIREFAKRNGYIILPEHVFIDEGISGRKAEKRPAFMKMVAYAKQKPAPFDMILVHKIDRFARSREDSVVYKSLLRRECGVKVVSITENIEDDKFSVILEAMLEAMAEYYSLNLSEEVKKGMTEKAKRGGLQSIPSFGYTVHENVLVPHPEEAELVRKIFVRFMSGEGYYTIARWLNELGIRTHRGNKFEHRTIEYIIRNPVYIGKLRWNPSGKTKRGDYDNAALLTADGKHDAIIDTGAWQAAQARVNELKAQWRKHMRPPTEHRDWLSGLVRCSSCGNTLIRNSSLYWKCNSYVKGACTSSQHISDEKIKSMILSALSEESKKTYKLDYVETIGSAVSSARDDLALRLERLDQKMKRAREAYISGIDTLEDYRAVKAMFDSERHEIEAVLSELGNAPEPENRSLDICETILDIVSILKSSTVPITEKHKAAHDLVKEIIYDKNRNSLSITFFA